MGQPVGYDLFQGLWVIIITLALIASGLFLTRKVAWQPMEKVLLILGSVCYFLDTLWWYNYWHFSWSDILFTFKSGQYKLTIFFVLAGIFFIVLFYRRFKRKRGSQH